LPSTCGSLRQSGGDAARVGDKPGPCLVFVLSADYATATGGYRYNQRLIAGLARLGWRFERTIVPAGFPNPDASARAETAAVLAGLPDGTLVMSDQLCFCVIPDIIARHAERLRLVIIVHHPLALEGYGPPHVSQALQSDEARALLGAAAVIVTSHATATMLRADYGVPAGRLIVAEPGTDRLPLAIGSASFGGPLSLLCVGALVPRKGHDDLLAALVALRELPWRLTCAGDSERTAAYVARLRRQAAAARLEERVTFTGVLSEAAIEAIWQSADVYVSASHHEGYGMAIAEALARGLPVVTTEAGAVAGWLPRDAAELVETGDVAALSAALRRVIGEVAHRHQLQSAARQWRDTLTGRDETAAIVSRHLQDLIRHG
jgi:glycosyltransferase involved in cell wall biosynthesis